MPRAFHVQKLHRTPRAPIPSQLQYVAAKRTQSPALSTKQTKQLKRMRTTQQSVHVQSRRRRPNASITTSAVLLMLTLSSLSIIETCCVVNARGFARQSRCAGESNRDFSQTDRMILHRWRAPHLLHTVRAKPWPARAMSLHSPSE